MILTNLALSGFMFVIALFVTLCSLNLLSNLAVRVFIKLLLCKF